SKTEDFMANEAKGKDFQEAYDIESVVSKIEKPRKIILVVQPGNPTDKTMETLRRDISEGGILVDGRTALYEDNISRYANLAEKNIHFIGTGVSGGEEGALKGPSLMPGGQKEAYDLIEPVFDAISAKVDGESCSTYIGPSGAGHYVKMVHN